MLLFTIYSIDFFALDATTRTLQHNHAFDIELSLKYTLEVDVVRDEHISCAEVSGNLRCFSSCWFFILGLLFLFKILFSSSLEFYETEKLNRFCYNI